MQNLNLNFKEIENKIKSNSNKLVKIKLKSNFFQDKCWKFRHFIDIIFLISEILWIIL